MKKSIKGFTLVEMLVVVAIIGILTAAVLVALGPSRDKARDTRIISAVNQVRALMEVYFNPSTGEYDITTLKGKDAYIAAETEVANNQKSSEVTDDGLKTVPETGESAIFSVSAQLNFGKWWCTDSTGFSGQTDSIGVATCPLPVAGP